MNVAVLGGGLTGLTAAWKLAEAGHTVRVLDSGSRLGGMVRTDIFDGWMVEAGPNSFRNDSPEIDAMLGELGLGAERIEPAAVSKRSYISLAGKLEAVPSASSPGEFLSTPLLSMGAKLKVGAESAFRPKNRSEDLSVADFVREHFGSAVLERIGQPLVSGIWAGDAERLSVRHAFPQAWEAERATGSLIRALSERSSRRREQGLPSQATLSFRRGMQDLPDALASKLPKGATVLNAAVRSVMAKSRGRWRVSWTGADGEQAGDFDRVVAALPGYSLSQLEIGAAGARPLSGLSDIEYPPLASVFVGYRRDKVGHPLDGFGALVPATERRSILGVIFTSSLFPDRAPKDHVALTVLAGGALNPGVAGMAPDILTGLVCKDLETLLGARGQPAFVRHALWPRGIPQYNLGFERHAASMAACEKDHPGLFIGGSVRDGISVPECLKSGVSLAARVS